MIRAVLDVNTLASAALNEQGLPALVSNLAFAGAFELVVSNHIIEKLAEVFGRPYFVRNVPEHERERILAALTKDLLLIEPDDTVRGVAPDLEDDLVLGTSVAANADFLVTGDKGLIAIGEYRGVRIITAGSFLEALAEAEGNR